MLNFIFDKIKNFLIVVAVVIFAIILFGIYAMIISPGRALKPISSSPVSRVPSTAVIDGRQFKVWLAVSASDQQKGLAVFNSLPADEGMLFIFPTSSYYGFWMKDMKFPIDILWIENGVLAGIQNNAPVENVPDSRLSNYFPPEPINEVLEINAGLAQKYGFKIGDNVSVGLPAAGF